MPTSIKEIMPQVFAELKERMISAPYTYERSLMVDRIDYALDAAARRESFMDALLGKEGRSSGTGSGI